MRLLKHTPDFHMSRCACSVSPHCGERWWNSSSLMAHRSFPVRSWKAFPACGSLYRCSVHSSHFWTFPVFHSIGSTKKQREREEGEKTPSLYLSKSSLVACFQCLLCPLTLTYNTFTQTTKSSVFYASTVVISGTDDWGLHSFMTAGGLAAHNASSVCSANRRPRP